MSMTNRQVAEAFVAGKEAENHRRTFYSKGHDPNDFGWRSPRETLCGEDNEGLLELWSYDMRIAIRFDSVFEFGPFDVIGDVKRFPEVMRPMPDQFGEWKARLVGWNRIGPEAPLMDFHNTPFILAVTAKTGAYSLNSRSHWWALEDAAQDKALVYRCDLVTDYEHRTQKYWQGAIYERAVPGPRGGKGKPQFLYSEYRVKTWTTHRGEVTSNDVGEGWRHSR